MTKPDMAKNKIIPILPIGELGDEVAVAGDCVLALNRPGVLDDNENSRYRA
jgi:hypothetical protein